uniref:Anillin domain-containing protein n=1 Tax=Trichuris muris TaxID=70415 RepID=A0A5S6QH04_TRIMR
MSGKTRRSKLSRTLTKSKLRLRRKIGCSFGSTSSLQKLRDRFIRGKAESASCRPSVRSSCRNSNVSVPENVKVESRMKCAAEKILQQWWLYNDDALSEASKSSIISKRRLELYESLQSSGLTAIDTEDAPATVRIKDIRIPLVFHGGESLYGRRGFDVFSVFAVFELGHDVCDTQLKTVVYGLDTDVQFDEVLTFKNVPAGFSLRLIIYSRALPSKNCHMPAVKSWLHMANARRKHAFTDSRLSAKDIQNYNDFEVIAAFRLDAEHIGHSGFVILDLDDNACKLNFPPSFGHVTFHLQVGFDCFKRIVSDETLAYEKCGQVQTSVRCILSVSSIEVIAERSDEDQLLTWIPLTSETRAINNSNVLEICSPDGLLSHCFTGSAAALSRLYEAIQLQKTIIRKWSRFIDLGDTC